MIFQLELKILLKIEYLKVRILGHVVQLSRRITKKAFQITDEPVDVSLPVRLVDDVLVVVVPQAPGQLLVVHLGLVLAQTPPPRHLVRVAQLELPAVAGPGDERVRLPVRQQLEQELPELDRAGALVAGEQTWLLCCSTFVTSSLEL